MMLEQPSTPDDHTLVHRASHGDKSAFEAIYRRHVGRVRALCLRMSADPVATDDLVQLTFVRAWEHLGSFESRSSVSTWLHRVAVNQVLQHQRSGGRRQARVLALPDPEQRSDPRSAALLDLERALAGLPDGARMVFVLHDVEGHGHPEIADMLGVSVGTSKSQLHRARELLREALGHER